MLDAVLPTWIIIATAISFAQFGIDKAHALAGRRRLPERDLLLVVLLGGTAGGYAGRSWFRHKTRKEPFSTRLHVIAVLQAGLVIGWLAAR